MTAMPRVKTPAACTEEERQAFARLVRQGFDGSDDTLDDRIRGANRLAFHYTAGGTLAAIAGLKAPGEQYRNDVFTKADAGLCATEYPLELGWIFVRPDHRGKGLGQQLCEQLLERPSSGGVFATTRTDNAPMMRILDALHFKRIGKPYPRRDEQLVLFVR